MAGEQLQHGNGGGYSTEVGAESVPPRKRVLDRAETRETRKTRPTLSPSPGRPGPRAARPGPSGAGRLRRPVPAAAHEPAAALQGGRRAAAGGCRRLRESKGGALGSGSEVAHGLPDGRVALEARAEGELPDAISLAQPPLLAGRRQRAWSGFGFGFGFGFGPGSGLGLGSGFGFGYGGSAPSSPRSLPHMLPCSVTSSSSYQMDAEETLP